MSYTFCWNSHSFQIFLPWTTWNDVGGIYIFAKRSSPTTWTALYIGKASSFKGRLANHERLPEALRAGATHIHAMCVSTEQERARVEQELIKCFDPPLNTQYRPESSTARSLAEVLGLRGIYAKSAR